jgi:hypothetical protein
MKKETAVLLVIAALASGFLIGREFPRHHYEALANGMIIFDASTGKVCDMRSRYGQSGAVYDEKVFSNNQGDNALEKERLQETPSGLPRCQ